MTNVTIYYQPQLKLDLNKTGKYETKQNTKMPCTLKCENHVVTNKLNFWYVPTFNLFLLLGFMNSCIIVNRVTHACLYVAYVCVITKEHQKKSHW